MIVSQPPYALAATPFRFPALASLAGRAALGGDREVALATYLAARLAHDTLPDRGLSQPIRAERATAIGRCRERLTVDRPGDRLGLSAWRGRTAATRDTQQEQTKGEIPHKPPSRGLCVGKVTDRR